MNRYDAVLFDLDGTLLYTLSDIAAAVNGALREMHRPERTVAEVRSMVGNGAKMLIARALGAGQEALVDETLHIYASLYAAHAQEHVTPYEGIPELLDALSARGIRTACVTNKDQTDAVPMLHKFLGDKSAHVEGRKPGRPTKPAPDAVYDALKALGVDASRALYVGDSGVDSETAKNAALPCVLCDWGYWNREKLVNCAALGIISAPAELLQYV